MEEIVINVQKCNQEESSPKANTGSVGYNPQRKQFHYNNGENYPRPNAHHFQSTRIFRPQQGNRQNYQHGPRQPRNQFSAPQNFQPNRFSAPQNFNNRQFPGPQSHRFSSPGQQIARFCNYCKRHGHLEDTCFNKFRACFICGELGHFGRNCPQNGNNYRRNRSQSQPPPQEQGQSNSNRSQNQNENFQNSNPQQYNQNLGSNSLAL